MFDETKVKAWTGGVPVEGEAVTQIQNITMLPVVAGHIAIMPDVHLGKGATVGSVIPTKGAIIPAAVGVDIGCGMVAVQLDLKASDLPDSLQVVRAQIERDVPVGFGMHRRSVAEHGLQASAWSRRSVICTSASTRWRFVRAWARWMSGACGSRSERSAAATTSSSCAWTKRRPCG